MRKQQPLHRKKIRLAPENYFGARIYFVTICCDQRRAVFRNSVRATALLARLRTVAEKQAFAVHAYCIMPDHLHILVEGQNKASNLLRFVNQLKQETSFDEKRLTGRVLWQRYFYDHVLRSRDAAEAVAWYIWLNPVRKELCAGPEEYPWVGSFTLEWKRQAKPPVAWSPPWKNNTHRL